MILSTGIRRRGLQTVPAALQAAARASAGSTASAPLPASRGGHGLDGQRLLYGVIDTFCTSRYFFH